MNLPSAGSTIVLLLVLDGLDFDDEMEDDSGRTPCLDRSSRFGYKGIRSWSQCASERMGDSL